MTALIRRSMFVAALGLYGAGAAEPAAPALAAPSSTPRSFDASKSSVTRTTIPSDERAVTAPRATAPLPSPGTSSVGVPYGPSLSTAGDINGAGYSEQLVGLPTPGLGGSVKVLYRAPGGTTIQTLTEPGLPQTCFGQSVASADVNGDGFLDAIVGDPLLSSSVTAEGAIHVYHGTAFGLPSLPTTTRQNGGAFANFGYSVSYAGDVNGDGYDDVIVGAPTQDNTLNDEGAAYVYLGGANGLAAVPVWHLEGATNFGFLGFDVSTAGDVNGDGYDDVVIGEPYYVGGESAEGRVHVYFGSSSGPQNATNFEYESDVPGANLGWSVATAGDANADGYSEFAAGAPYYTNGEAQEGAVYLFSGSASVFFSPPPIVAQGESVQGYYGWDLACGSDFNSDGFADLIAGRPGDTNLSGVVGSYDVLLGMSDLSDWPFPGNFVGTVVGGAFGQRVGIGGDVNGDGFSDPLTLEFGGPGAPNGGSVEPTLVELRGFSLASIGFGTSDQVAAGPYNSGTGTALAIGDVNGDGYDDLLAGGPIGPNGSSAGILQLYLGHPAGLGTPPPLPFLYPPPDWTYVGNQPGAQLGFDVAIADVNGDGFDDILAGALAYENGQSVEGAAFAFYGSAGGPSTSPDWVVEGNIPGAAFAVSIASAGDVNGDGFEDVLIGTPYQSLGELDEGGAYLYYGSALGLSNTPARSYQSNDEGGEYGYDVAGLGDVDGDGYDDFGIGYPGYSNGETSEGAIHVYRGAPAGPGAVWDVVESNTEGFVLGTQFSSAGDVNGDGRADLLCGLPNATVGFGLEGQVRLYFGSASGFPAAHDWSVEGGAPNFMLGRSVSTAGDINGDGFSDFIAGLPGSYASSGSAQVYLGSATLPSFFYAQEVFEGLSGNTGRAVAGGGDFNGDGFGDVAVGSPLSSFGKGFQEGTVQYVLPGVLQPNSLNHRPIGPYRPLADTPIGTGLRSDATNAYRMRGRMRTVAGRGRVRTEVESKVRGAVFNAQNLVHSPWIKVPNPASGNPNTVPTTVNITGLTANTKYHWRARYATKSPLFNPSHWITSQANGPRQDDVRTAGGEHAVGVEPPMTGSAALALSGARPNPATFGATATFAYVLPSEGRVRLALHDASGRRVRDLLDRESDAGAGAAAWDLRDDAGERVAAGVYFARLTFGAESRESKVVVLP